MLKENEFFSNASHSVVSLSEIPGKGHWFDGVVDDDVLQTFIGKHLSVPEKPKLAKQFSLVTMNPASSGSRGGISIQQLEVPFQLSRLLVEKDIPGKGIWRVRTENVRRIRYRPVFGLNDRPLQLLIDDSTAPISIPAQLPSGLNGHIDFCSFATGREQGIAAPETRAATWKRCGKAGFWGGSTVEERGPDNSGPSSQVLAGRKLTIVFPEGDRELQHIAVSYSNSLYITGIAAQVTTDSNVSLGQLSGSGDSNMVLLGGPNMNQMAKKQFSSGYVADVSFHEDSFCISSKCFKEAGTGVAFLSPGPKRTLIFSVAGTDREGMLAAASFLPHSPASNVPEWVVVSKKRGWGFRGIGGVVGLGYWDYGWKLEVRKSYPADFGFDLKRSGATCVSSAERSGSLVWPVAILLVAAVALFVAYVVRRRKAARNQKYDPVGLYEAEAQHATQLDKGKPLEKLLLLRESDHT